MYLQLPLLLVCLAGFSRQDDTEDTTAATAALDDVNTEPTTEERIPTTLEFSNVDEDITEVEDLPTQPPLTEQPPQPQQLQGAAFGRSSRPINHRKRPRRQHHGFFNDGRYRNPSNNPNNPNSPYAFRGRPGQPPALPPQQQYQQYYDPRYYDPYAQATQDAYYGYTGYYYNYPPPNYPPQQYSQHQHQPYPQQPNPPHSQQQPYPQQPNPPHSQHQQQPYPPQPHQPQPHPPQPYQPPPPTEQIPELYYLQSPDAQGGQYQYKKVSVKPDLGRRRRPQRQQAPAYNQQSGYYAYNPYDPYRQPYYNQEYSQHQYQPQDYNYPPYQYQQPRGPRSPRQLRPGPPRGTPDPRAWRLTSSPARLDLTDAPPQFDRPDVPPNTREETSDQPVTAGAAE